MHRTRTALLTSMLAATVWSLAPIATQSVYAQDHDHAQADSHDQHEAGAHTHAQAAALKNPVPSNAASMPGENVSGPCATAMGQPALATAEHCANGPEAAEPDRCELEARTKRRRNLHVDPRRLEEHRDERFLSKMTTNDI